MYDALQESSAANVSRRSAGELTDWMAVSTVGWILP